MIIAERSRIRFFYVRLYYLRIPEQSYHPFRFIVTTDSAAL
jgi:hypothetical protein